MENPANRSQVNFQSLISDLVGMYHEDTVDVVISELVANALDAKAANIHIRWSSDTQLLTIEDDGKGIGHRDFARYHDFAAELKLKGDGIGFAGLGAKLSFEIADRVVTVTRHRGETIGSDWRWADADALEWSPLAGPELAHDGTKVQIHIRDQSVADELSKERIVNLLHRAYLPLFVAEFVERYARNGIYPNPPSFTVDGDPVGREGATRMFDFAAHQGGPVKRGGEDIGVRVIGTQSDDAVRFGLPFGVLLCTYGKAVKVDMLDVSPGQIGDRLFGIYEIPELAQFLTSNKSDFRDKRGRGRPLGKILDIVRNDLREYLESQGVNVSDPKRGRLSASLERELGRLADQLPELRDFREVRSRQAALRPSTNGETDAASADRQHSSNDTDSGDKGAPQKEQKNPPADTNGETPRRRPPRRRRGPQVSFAQQPERQSISWLDDDIITINTGHPAFESKLKTDAAKMTYCMFAIALAISTSGMVDVGEREGYVDHFMRAWGGP